MGTANVAKPSSSPVAIGGVGGSGTRLIAECLSELGFYMGSDLNEASDNLWFTLLFKRAEVLSSTTEEFDALVDIFVKRMSGPGDLSGEQANLIRALASRDRVQHPAAWLRDRARSLIAREPAVGSVVRWGWKEPNTHVVLGRLLRRLHTMRYIHVVRNGLDMAHSRNQNQLELWGKRFIGEGFEPTPYYSLRYWCAVHHRILEVGQSMGSDFLFLNYDDFCLNPRDGVERLCGFLGLEASQAMQARLLALVKAPGSVGRFKRFGTEIFDGTDLRYVAELGFDTRPDARSSSERSHDG